jgi:hypothetical protein
MSQPTIARLQAAAATTLTDSVRDGLPNFDTLFTPPAYAMYLALAGMLLWTAVYILVIRIGQRQKTYGIPLLAIALNFTWELYYIVFAPESTGGSSAVFAAHFLWLALDLVIVWQLVKHGRAEQKVPEIRRYWYPVLAVTFAAAFAAHHAYYVETTANQIFPVVSASGSAFALNVVMSALFIFMFFDRRDLHGLSYAAAWLKLVASSLISIANVIMFAGGTRQAFDVWLRPAGESIAPLRQFGTIGGDNIRPDFFYVMFAVVLLLDVIYLLLLTHARRALAAGASSVAGVSPEPRMRTSHQASVV